MRASRDDLGCAVGEAHLPRNSSPTPDIAVGDCGNTPQVVHPACMPKSPEKILEAKPKVSRKLRHGAVQHDTSF
jgi:hypothetical protein